MADTLDEKTLRIVVRDFAELVFEQAEKLRSWKETGSERVWKRQVRLLRKELSALGHSVSWKCTAPLREIKANSSKWIHESKPELGTFGW